MDGLASVRTIRVKAETSDGPAVSPSSNLVGGKTNERSKPGISSPAAASNYGGQSAARYQVNTVRRRHFCHRPDRVRAGDRQGSARRDWNRDRVRLLGGAV